MKRKIFQAVFGVGLALMVFENTVFASGLGNMDGITYGTGEDAMWIEEASGTEEVSRSEEEDSSAAEVSTESVKTSETEKVPAESEEATETENASGEGEETPETEEASEEGEETPETEEASGEGEETPKTEEAPPESEETTEESGETTETDGSLEEGGEAEDTDETPEENGETTTTDEPSTDSEEPAETESEPEESDSIAGAESKPEETDDIDTTEEELETDSAADQMQKDKMAAPKFVIKGIFGGRTVTLTSESQDAVIYYKSGSSNITLQDQHIENGGTVTFTNFYGTIYAKAYKDGVWSDASKFILKIPVVNTPTITVEGNKATIRSTTPSSYICYTTDGSKPSWENGKRIANSGGTVTVEEGSTIRAVAVRSCFTDSQEVKAYVPVLPVAFEVKGVFGGRNVTMTSNTAGAEIYYSTTTGSITTNDKKLANGGNIDFSDFYGTVYARAYKNGKWSNVSRLILKIPNVNTPRVTVAGNLVTVSTSTPSCYICYTTDGTDPSPTNGTKIYGSKVEFSVPSGRTVRVMAMRSCFTSSGIISTYVQDNSVVRTRGSGYDTTGMMYSRSHGSYSRWSHVMRGNIYQNADGTYTAVEGLALGFLYVDTYDRNFNLLSSRSLPMELGVFGGFYHGEKYNYIVFGANNSGHDDQKVTFKVVKYDQNWNKLGAADYANNDTAVPFDAGSLRMIEKNGYLYIRTCHEMYSGHQSNTTFCVNTSTMKIVNGFYSGWGYVSHSFNQFIAEDEGHLVAVDLGDAYPRAVVLTKTEYTLQEDGTIYSILNGTEAKLLSIPGPTGANCTGVTLGGFEVTSNNYMVAISKVDHNKVTGYTSYVLEGLDRDERDIVLLLTPRNNPGSNVKTVKLTDYVNRNMSGSTPYLVEISDDRYVVLWEEYRYTPVDYGYGTYYNTETIGVRYVVVDGDGNKLTSVQLMSGWELNSDCQPVYIGNEVIWYSNRDVSADRFIYRIHVR